MLDEFSYSSAIFREGNQNFYWIWKTTILNLREFRAGYYPLWGHAVNRMYIPDYLHKRQIFLIPFKQLWVYFDSTGWLKYYPLDMQFYEGLACREHFSFLFVLIVFLM